MTRCCSGAHRKRSKTLEAAGIAYDVVPGVTAALAASAGASGVSLTRRGMSRNVVFATPRVGDNQSEGDWVASVLAADTAAIYMGAGQADAVATALIARGRAPGTPVALAENVSLPSFRVRYGTLAELPCLGAGVGPAVILLGEVLRERWVAWRDATQRPVATAA